MSRWPSEAPRQAGPIQHYLRAQTQWLARRLRQPHICFLDAPQGQKDAPLDAFGHWCAEHAGSNARVLLSGTLTHQYVLPQEDAQTRYGQTRTHFARRHFVQYYGEPAQSWPLDTWGNMRHHGACVIHGVDLVAMQAIAKLHRVRLQGVAPAWAWLLRWLSLRNPSWEAAPHVALVLVERAFITWLLCTQGSVVEIQQRRLQSATVQDLALRIEELKAQHAPALPVWVGGFGLDCGTPVAKHGLHLFTVLDGAHLPQELLL